MTYTMCLCVLNNDGGRYLNIECKFISMKCNLLSEVHQVTVYFNNSNYSTEP